MAVPAPEAAAGGVIPQVLAFLGLQAADLEAIALLIGMIGGVLGYVLISRRAARQALRVERSQAYLQLEFASMEVFKYRSEKADAMHWAITGRKPLFRSVAELEEEVDQYHFQCLNLFEVASRFRSARIIEPAVYASWLAWFIEVIEVPYFRRQWWAEYRDNYTVDLQTILDRGVLMWDAAGAAASPQTPDQQGRPGEPGSPARLLREEFYRFVGYQLACPVVANWLVQDQRAFSWLHAIGARWRLARLAMARTIYGIRAPDGAQERD